MKNKISLILSSLVAITLLAGCSKDGGAGEQASKSEKIDPQALQKLDEAVGAYRKIVTSMEQGGLTKYELRSKVNDADFALRDVASYFTAKKINTELLGFKDINQLCDDWSNLIKEYENAEDLEIRYRQITSGHVDKYSTQSPGFSEKGGRWATVSYAQLRSFLERYPEAKSMVSYSHPQDRDSRGHGANYVDRHLPNDVVDELIINYKVTENEPKNFLDTFESKYGPLKYGFGYTYKEDGWYDWKVKILKSDMQSCYFRKFKEQVEFLNIKIKEQM